ncbi:MAG: hypothetical protein ACRC80_05690 [Waterburya sp.]
MNNLNKELFTELTLAESALIQGGAIFRDNIFEEISTRDNTKVFKVSPGSDVKLSTFTDAYGSNDGFYAELQNLTTGKNYGRFPVKIGNDTNIWTGLAGGNDEYRIQCTDIEGNIFGTRGDDSLVVS